MVTPTLIKRTDYRVYEIPTQFPSSYYKEHLSNTEKAINSYLLDRDIDYQEAGYEKTKGILSISKANLLL